MLVLGAAGCKLLLDLEIPFLVELLDLPLSYSCAPLVDPDVRHGRFLGLGLVFLDHAVLDEILQSEPHPERGLARGLSLDGLAGELLQRKGVRTSIVYLGGWERLLELNWF